MGSSRSSMSGSDSRSRHNATRRRSPPESLLTSASHGGSRNASAATSSLRPTSQPFTASILPCSSPCSSSSLFISSSSRGSAKRSLISLKRLMRSIVEATPSSTFPRTSLFGSRWGSWGSNPTRMLGMGIASPSKSLSTPAMMRSRLDLPEPFRPSTPILAPGKNESEISLRITRFGGTTLPTRRMV